MNDQQIEQEIQAKGLTAPRVTLADLEANSTDIEIVKHVSKSGQVLRWAVLTTRCGYAAVGKHSCSVSNENDDAELGEKIAIANTKADLWPLMGYELKQRLFEQARGDVNQYEVEQNEARLTLVRAIADELDLPKSVTCDEMLKAVVDLKKGVL